MSFGDTGFVLSVKILGRPLVAIFTFTVLLSNLDMQSYSDSVKRISRIIYGNMKVWDRVAY